MLSQKPHHNISAGSENLRTSLFFVRIITYRNVRANVTKGLSAIKSNQFENTHIHSFINLFIY